MEADVAGDFFRQRKLPSSERLLGIFPKKSDKSDLNGNGNGEVSVATAGVEFGDFDEDDVFWSGRDSSDLVRPEKNPSLPTADTAGPSVSGFRWRENFGILAALPEDDKKGNLGHQNRPFLNRKAFSPIESFLSSSSRMIPAIPKPHEFSQSVPAGKFYQSAPVNVPVAPRVAAGDVNKGKFLGGFEGEDIEEEILPPHEIVARRSVPSPMTTFSVLEGKGRTLKGRDLRQVRNAVWRQTGFLD